MGIVTNTVGKSAAQRIENNGLPAVAHFRRWTGATPPEVFFGKKVSRGVFDTRVVSNTRICREHYRLILRAANFPPTLPGQFLQIECGDGIGAGAFLRRPFSMAGRRDNSGGAELEIVHRIVGRGTQWLGDRRAGDTVSVLGPLGNHFELPGPGGQAVMVGGGVGIPPMLYLAERLAGRSAVAFVGATSGDLLPVAMTTQERFSGAVTARPIVGEFARHGIDAVVTTDDGSVGYGGRVTESLAAYLDSLRAGAGVTLYTCGPEPMMKAVAQIASDRGMECQVAVERAMACGMGTCQSCVIRCRVTGRLDGRDWAYRLACTDGPVFRGQELLW
jgi:dihydroorotate dehydrogenase electron transfer subunit